MDYTLADLARVTGAKRRSIQLWADAGVIMADKSTDRGGSGTHRRFSRNEAIIACIIRPFASHQVAIGELLSLSEVIRESLSNTRVQKMMINPAIAGDSQPMMSLTTWKDDVSDVAFSYNVTFHQTTNDLEFKRLHEPEGFAALICLRTYLAKIDY